MNPVDRLLTTAEAAQALAISPRTLEGWRTGGGGPLFVHLASKCVRYRWSDLQAWIEARVVANTSAATALPVSP